MPTVEQRQQAAPANGHEPTSVLRIPRSRIRRFTGQPRQYFDAQDMADLAASIEEIGQVTPIIVKEVSGDPKHDYELVDGERRWIACGMVGVETMLAWVRPFKSAEDDDEQFIASVVGNFGRSGHTPLETAQAIDRIKKSKRMWELSAGDQIARIAKVFARSQPWVYQHLAILRLHPEVQAMMAPTVPEGQRLNLSLALFISSHHHDIQREIAKTVVEKKMNIAQARIYARQVAEETGTKPGTGRGYKPSDDYKTLVDFIERTRGRISNYQDPTILNNLRRVDPRVLALAAKNLEELSTQLSQLRLSLIETRT